MSQNTFLAKLANKVFDADSQKQHENQSTVLQDLPDFVVPYIEEEPTVKEWIRGCKPTQEASVLYLRSLFPFTSWLRRYNVHWMLEDAIAGLTVGLVVIPQAMAYALLANLSPEYGLYTSFMGAALYWLFGTSKDIVIGTTAVGSLLVGKAIATAQAKKPGHYTAEEIAKSLSLLSGFILIFLGLFRLGWLIELIPYIPISAFVTSASFTIIGTQLPVALGITHIKTREAPYKVYISVFKGLGRTQMDAAIGLTAIALLYILKSAFSHLEIRRPERKRLWATLSSLRMTFTMLLYTLVGWLVHRGLPRGEHKFRLVGKIDSGFRHAGVPKASGELLGLIAPSLPSMLIILIVEHVAIAKSFGTASGYKINASQEILAQGASNVFGTFVGGYACTGSFGASAVLAKAGVRTPLAGLFSAGLLLLVLYALTAVFYYIPMAALAGLIIHAVANLMTPPSVLYRYWRLAPFELLIWIVGTIVALFLSLETSIYTTVALSFALLLVRMARSEGGFLGQTMACRLAQMSDASDPASCVIENQSKMCGEMQRAWRDVYLPLNKKETMSRIKIVAPYAGVFIYRFNEPLNYINKSQHMDYLSSYVTKNTRRTRPNDDILPKDRLWSDPPPTPVSPIVADLPILRAIILDCSTINNLDIASIQGLIEARNILGKHAAPANVNWHFSGLQNRWARRALAVAGFGHPVDEGLEVDKHVSPIYSVASSPIGMSEHVESTVWDTRRKDACSDVEMAKEENGSVAKEPKLVPVYGIDRPFFHVDTVDAADVAVRNARVKDELEALTAVRTGTIASP
ncbi:sulfate transporter family-domain-containing protein [Phaeosphaeriaceae sp. PMI808]|nr:sulfate transporter family-domain-containing protein [Phaeosphaeriaceae sp. PMI808]